jgi:uncharacterized protein
VTRPSRPYSDPYLAGFGLGLVLLAALVLSGRGLGASGAFASAATAMVAAADPAAADAHPFFARYRADGGPARDWLVFEIVGVLLGGLLSSIAAGRWQRTIERGPRMPRGARLVAACAGGAVMGVGAVLARGCTSGLGLTGGALLAAGSWGFLLAAFGGAYLAAPVLRLTWR